MKKIVLVLSLIGVLVLSAVSPAAASSYITISDSAAGGHLSSTGAYTWFVTNTKLVAGDTNTTGDAYLRDNATGAVKLVSATSAGSATSMGSNGRIAVGYGTNNVSVNGRYALFAADTQVIPAVAAGKTRLYRKDLQTGAVELLDRDQAGTPSADGVRYVGGISDDGSVVAFTTISALLSSDTDTYSDVYVWRSSTGTLTLASTGTTGNANGLRLATGGAYLVYSGFSPILNGCYDDYRVKLSDLSVVNITQNPYGECAHVTEFSISSDGSRIAFVTEKNYDTQDVEYHDLYIWDAATGQRRWLSKPWTGASSQPTGNSRLFALGRLTSGGKIAVGTTVRLAAGASQSSATAATAYLMDVNSGVATAIAPGAAPSYLIGNVPDVNEAGTLFTAGSFSTYLVTL